MARCVIEFIDKLTCWVGAQRGLRLLGSSILMVYEGDSTVAEPKAAQARIMDFEHVSQGSATVPDAKYLVAASPRPPRPLTTTVQAAIQNLRWMLERFHSYDQLEVASRGQCWAAC